MRLESAMTQASVGDFLNEDNPCRKIYPKQGSTFCHWPWCKKIQGGAFSFTWLSLHLHSKFFSPVPKFMPSAAATSTGAVIPQWCQNPGFPAFQHGLKVRGSGIPQAFRLGLGHPASWMRNLTVAGISHVKTAVVGLPSPHSVMSVDLINMEYYMFLLFILCSSREICLITASYKQNPNT